MEFFLPSVFLMMISLFAAVFVVPKMGPALIVSSALILIVVVLYNHSSTFANDYNFLQWAASAQQLAPVLLTSLVIALVGGYLLYMYGLGGKLPDIAMPSSNIPPPATATNFMTRAIGSGLAGMGAAGIARNYSPPRNTSATPIANTAHRNVAASVLSAGV
jgi:hypothetical protein